MPTSSRHFVRRELLSYTFLMITWRQLHPRWTALFVVGAGCMVTACGGDGDATVGTVPPASVASSTTAPATSSTTTTSSTVAPELTGDPEFDELSSVSTVGIDVVTFGMTITQAERALEGTLVAVTEPFETSCYQVRPGGGPTGVELTVTAGTIERVDVTTDMITTRSGAGVGMSEEDLFALFSERLTSEASSGGGNTVVFTPADPGDAAFRVIFETDGTVVTSFRAGRVPQVEPTTPCT